jgi:hypothetical protein
MARKENLSRESSTTNSRTEEMGRSEAPSELLRELVAHLRQNRTQLREEWVARISETRLLGDVLIATFQAALSDADLSQLRSGLVQQVVRFRSRGVIVDVTAMDVMDSFASRTLREISLDPCVAGEADFVLLCARRWRRFRHKRTTKAIRNQGAGTRRNAGESGRYRRHFAHRIVPARGN